ncbi:hypothetical protein NH340_JMT00614 [Sarcoptes scabiei]|nr:hypothetical protein NH340_JMT00614 [Sarcoptes scabiei]
MISFRYLLKFHPINRTLLIQSISSGIIKPKLLSEISQPLLNHAQVNCFSTKPSRKKAQYFTWKTFLISGALASFFFYFLKKLKDEKLRKMEKQRKKALGQAQIGGRFELIDQNGKPFTSHNLEGKWAMVYFGFTHCPDVCPDELEKILTQNETVSKPCANIIKEFSPKFIGLTGTKEKVEQATRAYRVYYSAGPRDQQNDYIVDHTIITYLINPEGDLVDYYGQTKTAEDICSGTLKAMKNYKSLKRKLGFI